MRDLGLLILRLAAGTVLIGHGYTKLFGGLGKQPPEVFEQVYGPGFPEAVERTGHDKFEQTLRSIGVPAPHISAYLSGLTEFAGGLSFVLGLKTRMIAPAVLFNMGTAIRKVHWDRGLYGESGIEFPLMLAGAAATLLLTGPGVFSLDAASEAADRLSQDGGDIGE